jgi:ketosteroid isomerase-like protein
MNESAGFESTREPLEVVRRLYLAWNAGDVAGAAELLSPAVRWESFGASPPEEGPQGLEATLAGSSHGTWMTIDLLVCVVDHVIAFTRRGSPHGDAEAERLEVWTLHDGRAVHYRGYPLDEGLAVLSETTGSRRLEALCRGVLAFNRGDVDGWLQLLLVSAEPGQRLDDVRVLAESDDALVVSALHHLRDSGRLAERLNLVIAFEGDRARRVVRHATREDAIAAAAGA